MFRYEIDEQNNVYGYVEGQEEPCLFQPYRPDGTAWQNQEDATAWAEAWIAHMSDPNNNEFPL